MDEGGPDAMAGVHIGRRTLGHRCTWRGRVRVEADIRVLQLQTEIGPGLSGSCQTLEEAQSSLPWSLKGPHGPAHTWTFAFWPPELGGNQSCYSKPFNLWSLAKAAPRKPHARPEPEDAEWLQCVVVLLLSHLCPPVHDPTDCSTPGFPVLHYLPEFAQTYVH